MSVLLQLGQTEAAMESNGDIFSPEDSAKQIQYWCDHKFEPEIAKELWPKILQHKWFLS